MPKQNKKIEIFGTLFRDGMQRRGMEISLPNALKIVKMKSDLGFDYAELGFAIGNDFSSSLIKAALKEDLGKMKVAVFGRTRKPKEKVEESADIKAILDYGSPVAVIVCKSRMMDVVNSLRTDGETNLKMITDSVSYLKGKGLEVILDLEHSFDAYFGRGDFGEEMEGKKKKESRDYFSKVVEAGIEAGADTIVVCDTNGGASVEEVFELFDYFTKKHKATKFGIHAHNDCGMAVANSRAAILHGACHVQGVTNGYGERCGNADLMELIPRLQIKDGMSIVAPESLKKFTDFSRKVTLAFNKHPRNSKPFVGFRAFSTYAGMHTPSQKKNEAGAYFHCYPSLVGNESHVGVNRQSGSANISYLAKKLGISLNDNQLNEFIKRNSKIIQTGAFEISEASFELACHKLQDNWKEYFVVEEYRTSTIMKKADDDKIGKAEIKIKVGKEEEHTISDGNGAYDALSSALKKALRRFYKEVDNIHLCHYEVLALGVSEDESGALVRVLTEFRSDNGERWNTVGVSTDQTDAARLALVDGLTWFLYKKGSQTKM